MTIKQLMDVNLSRVEKWHSLDAWSALEWAGSMAGEAGECCNAAKKLKRVEDGIQNINLETGRSLTTVETARRKVVEELADTFIYGVLLAARAGYSGESLEKVIAEVFNRKSEEYGFPERLIP